jgi:ubiquinone/menaquinone biosynthesis C-methylase UbiE
MNAAAHEFVVDEVDFLTRVVPIQCARVVELGCGKAELSRRLLTRGIVASLTALEVDTIQHAANLASPTVPGLSFVAGGAEAIPAADASFDGAMMLKSLHHVPMPLMDAALREIRRVLVPGGWLYVSEPVYAGPLNDVVKLFHDEGTVRAAAYAALQRAGAEGVLTPVAEHVFETPVPFRDFDDFVERMVRVTHSEIRFTPDVEAEVRRRFMAHMTAEGARFVRPMRINVLRRP